MTRRLSILPPPGRRRGLFPLPLAALLAASPAQAAPPSPSPAAPPPLTSPAAPATPAATPTTPTATSPATPAPATPATATPTTPAATAPTSPTTPATATAASPASATPATAAPGTTSLTATTGTIAAPSEASDPLAWHYARFRVSEGIATVTGGVLTVSLFLASKHADNAWHSGILFDDAARSALRASSQAGRDRAQIISTIPYYIGLSYPLLVDALSVTWIGRGHGDTAAQMAMIDLEAYAYAGTLSFLANNVGRRSRPFASDCLNASGGTLASCGGAGGANIESFYSGHTSLAFTGAMLTCTHHQAMPLYGGGLADDLICPLLLAISAVDGVGRIVADKHYASDVILGALVGSSVGYLTPTLLHYRYPVEKLGGFMVLPSFSPTFAGLAATSVM